MGSGVYAQIAQGYNPLTQLTNLTNLQMRQAQLAQQRFETQQAKLQPAYAGLMATRLKGDAATWDDVASSLADSQRLGADISGLQGNVQAAMAAGQTPADYIRAESIRGMPAWEQAQYVTDKPTSVETGAGTMFGTLGAAGGAHPGVFTPGGGFVPNQVSPQWLNEPDSWVGPDMQQHTGTRGDHLRAMGIDPGSMLQGGPPVSGPAGAGGGTTPLLPSGAPLADREAMLARVGQRESGMRNIPNQQGPGGSPLSTASGYYQMLDGTWQHAAKLAGLQNPPPRAMDASFDDQHAAALALAGEQGEQPWALSAPRSGGGAVYAQGGGGGLPPGSYQVASNAPVGAPSAAQPPTGPMPAQPRGFTLPGPYTAAQYDTSAKLYGQDMLQERTLGTRIQPWVNALDVLKANPDLKTGPTQQQLTQWQTAFDAAGIPFPSSLLGMQGDPAAYQQLAKYLAQGLRGQASASDLDRLQTEAGMPNPTQKRNAIQELVAMQIGAERMKTAGLRYFNSLPEFGGSTVNAMNNSHLYLGKTADWAGNQTQAAYGADFMDPEAVRDYYQHLPNAKMKQQFKDSLASAGKLFGVQMQLPSGPGG